jgi:hemolysin activation/secretion protein
MNKIINILTICPVLLCCLILNSPTTTAQTIPIQNLPQPTRDRFPQQIPTPAPLPTEKPTIQQPPQNPAPSTAPSSVQIPVQKVEIVGNTLLKPADLQRITQSIEGKSVTLTQLQELADGITQLYVERGYINSRAIVPQQNITNGIVQIQVVEGYVSQIDIQGLERLRAAYVGDRLQLGIAKPFNQNELEDQLRLLRADPLFSSLEASLRPGTGLGDSVLTVRLKEANALTGFVGVDDYSSPSTGADRIGAVVGYRNLTGIGDDVSASYYRSFQGGSNAYDFNYRVPVNPMNGTVQLRVAPSRTKIVDPQFASLGIRSDSDLYEISYRQPLIRSIREEFALSLAFAVQDGQTFLNENQPQPFGIGPDANGYSRTRVIKFGQDYLSRDIRGAWAFRSQFNLGINAFNATRNTGGSPDGSFFSWVGQVQRAQQLDPNQLLIAQADLQLSPDSLLPAQQLTLGGGQSLRGYSQNARFGDNGIRVSVEDRIALQKNAAGIPTIQIVPFIDMGAVWNNPSNPNTLSNRNFLASAGVGTILEPFPQFNIRADLAIPLVNLNQSGESAQTRWLSFSAGYSF